MIEAAHLQICCRLSPGEVHWHVAAVGSETQGHEAQSA